MKKLEALWLKYCALPWHYQVAIGVAVGVVAGRLGAPWLI